MNFNQLMRQAQQMQKKANKTKKEFELKEFDFNSQQDLIKIKMNGRLEIADLNISEDLLDKDNKEMLQDLLTVTLNEAIKNIEKQKEDTLNAVTNGVDVSMFM